MTTEQGAALADDRRVRIEWEDGSEATECPLESFVADNAASLTPADVRILRTMPVDYELWIGGGAAALVKVTRTA